MITRRGFKWIISGNTLHFRQLSSFVRHKHLRLESSHKDAILKPSWSKMDDRGSDRRSTLRSERMKYKYTPLDPSQDSIRLLRLLPSASPDLPLRCELFHANLTDAPPYIALSYAWGTRLEKSSIVIGDQSLVITVSLKNALQRLRQIKGELVMWIDAVCINQEDIPERSAQTGNMRAIYQNADSVAVWLGLEYKQSGEAIQLARDLNSCTSADKIHELLTEREEDLNALVKLFRRQYWWRIWVIQEVTCGKRSTVYCGEDEITWDQLDKACDIFQEEMVLLQKIFYKHHTYVRTLVAGGPKGLQISRYSPGNDTPPLLELLTSHKGKKSTDPKDKVFALVGISSSRYDFGKIDYSKSLRDIYSHTARHIISGTKRLDIICLKQNDVVKHDIPSWAPNWTRAPSSAGATLLGLHHRTPVFNASADLLASTEFVADGYVLKAKGMIIDQITGVGAPFLKKGAPTNPTPPLRVFRDWWDKFTARHSDTIKAQALFARTISCGSWQHDDEEECASKLNSIFDLALDLLSDEDGFRSNPPSRASTFMISRSATMSSSVSSLLEDDAGVDDDLDFEERERLGSILSASMTMNRRRLVLSKNGFVGLGLWNAAVGDLICILYGCRFPVVLRKSEDHYILVGEAYVDGIMNGEALDDMKNGVYETEIFEIH